MKTIKIVTIALFSLVVLFFLFSTILLPAYHNTKVNCAVDMQEMADELGVTILGSTTFDRVNNTITVNIIYDDPETRKHEHIHVVQAKQHRMFGCFFQPLNYLTEVEAHAFSKLPDAIYIFIYGEY